MQHCGAIPLRSEGAALTAVTHLIRHHFRHFNTAALVDATDGYQQLLASGGKMLLALGSATSTAEIGLSLAEMIRQDKVHAISCTGANLEEDVFNLVAHNHYERVPHDRDLTPAAESAICRCSCPAGKTPPSATCMPPIA